MFISKPGSDHIKYDLNNQDGGVCNEKIKCVTDGCGSGAHSEIGAKLFPLLAIDYFTGTTNFDQRMNWLFEDMLGIFGKNPNIMKNYLSFTTLLVFEESPEGAFGKTFPQFITKTCGDGYIILQDIEDDFTYLELGEDNKSPEYFIYNFIEKQYLKAYIDGVSFKTDTFPKDFFVNVGVATDGLRYLLAPERQNLLIEFEEYLRNNKESKLRRFMNKYRQIFKDDITIAW